MYRKMTFKTLSLILALLFSVSVFLAGCGGKTTEEKGSTAVTDTPQESSAVQSSAEQTEKEELQPVTLKWYYESSRPKDADEVFAKANEIIKQEINATVDFQPIDWGTFDQKIPLILASGEEFDILWSASWAAGSKYNSNAAKGAIIPLDGLIERYAPLTKSMIPQNIWDGCKIGGKIYGVPAYQIMATAGAVGINMSIADKYGFNPDSVKSMWELESLYEKIKKGDPSVACLAEVPMNSVWTADNFPDMPVREVPVLGVKNDLKVINLLTDDQPYIDYLKKARDWYLKGYLPKDVATAKDPTYQDGIKAGKVATVISGWKPGGEGDLKNTYGLDFYLIRTDAESMLSTSGITATMNCISKTSKYPERSMMFLEQISQNKELYNTLVFGLEDKHYKKISDSRIEVVKDPGYSAYSWMMGNQFLAYLVPGQADDVWQQTIDLNNSAKKTSTCGFTFDSEPVKTEIAQMNAITTEFRKLAAIGIMEPEKLIADYNEKYEKAGLQKVKDELQKQIDAWKATK